MNWSECPRCHDVSVIGAIHMTCLAAFRCSLCGFNLSRHVRLASVRMVSQFVMHALFFIPLASLRVTLWALFLLIHFRNLLRIRWRPINTVGLHWVLIYFNVIGILAAALDRDAELLWAVTYVTTTGTTLCSDAIIVFGFHWIRFCDEKYTYWPLGAHDVAFTYQ